MTPNDLQKDSIFQLVYEGKLMFYHNKEADKVHVPVHFTTAEM
jgi:hypothetical protein